ncbi:low temperature-induced protein [Lyngbya aestuarii]|uniref:low temperature-induced protein n=1 Tax=Lyngbya aestuarii TaxID=118322 RepID=UPI00403E2C44
MFSFLRPLRFLMALFIGTWLFFSSASPAAAASSSPTKGEDQLKRIEQKSEEVLKSGPRGLKETTSEANKGINEVQGSADVEKMKQGESQNATSVEQQVKEAVKNIMGS